MVLVGQLRAAQQNLAQRTRLEERNRIARELHDIIGHSLTVVLLHLASARMAVSCAPGEAEDALLEAERLGRRALEEVRATVGVLRVDASHDELPDEPLPGLADIETLVNQLENAGTFARLTVKGDLAAPPGTVGLAAYRIAQEALTNAARHGPGAPVDVSLAVERESLTLVVSNSRPTVERTAHGSPGVGLLNMLERAEAVGGVLTVESDGEVWEIRSVLPLPSST
jgi:signal transduction histidine kinase